MGGGRTFPVLHSFAASLSAVKPDYVAALLNRGADVNGRDFEGWTALMHAAASGNVGAAQLLLSHGADLNLQEANGETALMMAVTFAHKGGCAVAQALLDAGADADVTDKHGASALARLAIHNTSEEGLEAARALLAAGADAKAPLERALACGNSEALELLLAAGADPTPLLCELLEAAPAPGEPASAELLLLLRAGASMEGLPVHLKRLAVDIVIQDRCS